MYRSLIGYLPSYGTVSRCGTFAWTSVHMYLTLRIGSKESSHLERVRRGLELTEVHQAPNYQNHPSDLNYRINLLIG